MYYLLSSQNQTEGFTPAVQSYINLLWHWQLGLLRYVETFTAKWFPCSQGVKSSHTLSSHAPILLLPQDDRSVPYSTLRTANHTLSSTSNKIVVRTMLISLSLSRVHLFFVWRVCYRDLWRQHKTIQGEQPVSTHWIWTQCNFCWWVLISHCLMIFRLPRTGIGSNWVSFQLVMHRKHQGEFKARIAAHFETCWKWVRYNQWQSLASTVYFWKSNLSSLPGRFMVPWSIPTQYTAFSSDWQSAFPERNQWTGLICPSNQCLAINQCMHCMW